MKKISVVLLIFFLILSTALVKNSTKRINDMIFNSEENMRSLKKDFETIKLEYNYLSSTEKLLEFQNLYFDDELIKKDIQKINILNIGSDKLKVEKLKFMNE